MLASSTFGADVPAVGENRDDLARSVIGQAKHDEIDGRHCRLAGGKVLAALRREAVQDDTGDAEQALADTEAGGAGLAIDEYALVDHRRLPAAFG